MLEKLYPEVGAGGFTRVDGTVQFFTRVRSLLNQTDVVLDFGAGRGRLATSESSFRRELANLRPFARKVIAVDVDEAVLENRSSDERHVTKDNKIPLANGSVDLVVADHVFEHIKEPKQVVAELVRVLRPGGWLCARTPHIGSLAAIAGRVIPNRLHSRMIRRVQPGEREDRDVFPTEYKLNSKRAMRHYFPPEAWRHCSYSWTPEPAYHFGSIRVVAAMRAVQYLKRPLAGEVLMVFLQKL